MTSAVEYGMRPSGWADVATRDEALRWAATIAEACRCPQAVRAFADEADA